MYGEGPTGVGGLAASVRRALGFGASAFPASSPKFMDMAEQFATFKYSINVGRNAGWCGWPPDGPGEGRPPW